MADVQGRTVTVEGALEAILRYAKEEMVQSRSGQPFDGFSLRAVIDRHLAHLDMSGPWEGYTPEGHLAVLSSPFLDAAWELCRRGYLRPGKPRFKPDATDGELRNRDNIFEFVLVDLGRQWIEQAGALGSMPLEPSHWSKLLDRHTERLGAGFQQRSQEALKCLRAGAHLACCAMCGAAAESILLAIAIAKAGDEEGVLKEYLTRGGRQRIENRVVGPQPDWIRDQFRGCTGLLNYWRDSAAHGRHSDMQYAEAHTALSQLLWFAQFADDQWELLTATGGRA